MSSSSQRRWTAYKGRSFPAPLFIAALLFLTSSPPVAQGAIDIPKSYKINNMLQPPILTATPKSFTAFSPEDIYLPCEASGNPPPTFRWMKDGEVFGPEMEESGTLRAEDDEPLDSYKGTYSCYAKNTLGTAITQPVQIIVESQPVLLKQQKVHKSASEGDSIILSCHPPQSSTPPHIHWMDKRMVHIKQSDRVTVGLNGKLYFSNVLKTDSRDDYICNAQYTEARTILPETAVTLTVTSSNAVPQARKPHFFVPFQPPGSSEPRSSVLALRGNSLTLECIPKGLPTPKVEWVKRDGSLEDTSAEVENFGRWLYFSSVQQQDDGEYECRASNIHGSVVHSFSVSVEAAPYWVKEPQNLRYAPGETVRLDCLAEGIPKPEVTWSINGIPITDVSPDPRLSFVSGALILRDVGFSDNAVYQCQASNRHGSILINSFLFVVELPPQILSSDGVVYKVMEGGDVQLHCESFGSPRPYVTWEREHLVPLLSDPRVSLLTNGTIKVSNVTHEDGGVYTCFIKNSSVSSVTKSTISITANLEIYNRTIVHSGPQDLRLLRGSDALLDCRFYKDPRLHKVQVVWKKNGHKLQESSPDDKYTIFEDRTLKVTNVQPDDTAAYSCEVITSLDHVSSGGSITVVAPPDPPHRLTLSDTRDDSLTLSWTPGESHNSPITDFLVEAREEQHQEEVQWRWELWEKVPGDVQHRQLMLHPFSTYSFRVTAVNEQGNSSASRPSERHSTPPAVPSSNPVNVTSNSSEPGTLVITWAEMSKRFHNGQDFQYKVWWRKAKGKDLHWNTGFVKSPPFLVNNTGTFTSFEIKVQAVNALGVGPEPEAKIGHSGEDTPEESPGGVSTLVKNRTVVVKWNEAQRVRGRLLGYKIYIRRLGSQDRRRRRSLGKHHLEDQDSRPDRGQDRDRDHDPVRVEVVWGNRTSAEVTELKLFSQYELSVTAFNSKGESPASTPHLFITPEGAPGPPASLTFDSPTEKSLILYWTPPLETNGILLGYVVQYQKEGQSMDSVLRTISDPSVNQILLENLDSSSYYILKVIAETRSGAGPPITSRGATLLDGVPPTNVTVVSCNTSFNLSWVPGERDRNHGFHFHYKKKPGPDRFKKSELVNSTQGFYLLTDLQPGSQYHLQIRHGNDTQWEDVKWTIGPVPSEVAGGFAAQGWLIGLISAIVLLVLILLILCLIKRSKGGKYAVKDKEDKEVDSEARPMKDETFGEYRSLESDGDEKRSDSQPSLCNESKLGSDDSLAEYGDSVDIQFNEDGSFIGQYSGRGPVPHGNESSGPASPVNAAPPPPIAPSMSSILNRPS